MAMPGQIEREFRAAETKAKGVETSLQDKIQAIATLQEENRNRVKNTAEKAYGAMEKVVNLLLSVEDGDERLSRRNTPIVTALRASVEDFELLCTISRKNKEELGIKGGDCKELGDGASRLARSLGQRATGLNRDATAVYTSRNEYYDKWQMYSGEEDNLQSRVRSRRSSVEVSTKHLFWRNFHPTELCCVSQGIGNAFLNVFDSHVGDGLRNRLRDAEDRLNANRQHQREAKDTAERFYKLAIYAKNASAAYMSLRQELERRSSDFGEEYVKVTEAQNVETNLWAGLIDLKDKVWSTDYISTRDRSLRQLLNLLTLDDAVFMRHEFFEGAEIRIKDAIVRKLGEDAIDRLVAGNFGLVMDDGEMVLDG